MIGFKEEIGQYDFRDGEEVTVEGVELVYRDGGYPGFYYSLKSASEGIRVLTKSKMVSDELYAANGRVQDIGLERYLRALDDSSVLERKDGGGLVPAPGFQDGDVEEELERLGELFLDG